MKLSDLIRYRNTLKEMSAINTWHDIRQDLQSIDHQIQVQSIQVENFASQFHQSTDNVKKAIEHSQSILDELAGKVDELVADTEKPWFQESYRLFEQEMCYETSEYILNRRPNNSVETENFYRSRLMRYSDWKYPAMIIRPGQENFIEDLVACDPLYLVDINHELLKPALDRYNEIYARRLRPYVIDDRKPEPILGRLPKGQFGLVFAYNYFNYKPFEVLRRYFTEILECLRPGGSLIMTINDCDRHHGVMLVEQHFCCYTPGYLVIEMAQSLGFELIFQWHDGGPSTWIEFKKPGALTTFRGGQALAKIMPK